MGGVYRGLGLWLFLLLYVSLMLLLAVLVALLPQGLERPQVFNSVWHLLLVNLAGVPPAALFVPKLGLLMQLGSSNFIILLALILPFMLVTWFGYYRLVQNLLGADAGVLCTTSTPPSVGAGAGAVLVVGVLAVGFVFIPDLGLIAAVAASS